VALGPVNRAAGLVDSAHAGAEAPTVKFEMWADMVAPGWLSDRPDSPGPDCGWVRSLGLVTPRDSNGSTFEGVYK
jgi:hypothetical protein